MSITKKTKVLNAIMRHTKGVRPDIQLVRDEYSMDEGVFNRESPKIDWTSETLFLNLKDGKENAKIRFSMHLTLLWETAENMLKDIVEYGEKHNWQWSEEIANAVIEK